MSVTLRPMIDADLPLLTGGEVLGNVSWRWVQWGPDDQSRNPMTGI